MHVHARVCTCVRVYIALVLALILWWRPVCPRVGLLSLYSGGWDGYTWPLLLEKLCMTVELVYMLYLLGMLILCFHAESCKLV